MSKEEAIKLPVEVINFCEQEALGQVLSWWDDRFSPEQIVEELRGLGGLVPSIVEWEDLFTVYSGFEGSTGSHLAKSFDDYFKAFIEVAELATLRARIAVKEAN